MTSPVVWSTFVVFAVLVDQTCAFTPPDKTPVIFFPHTLLTEIFEFSGLTHPHCAQRCLCREQCVGFSVKNGKCYLGKSGKMVEEQETWTYVLLRDRVHCVGTKLFELIPNLEIGQYRGECPSLPPDENECFDDPATNQVVGPIPYNYYRIGRYDYDPMEINCAKKCLHDKNCQGIERDARNLLNCYQVKNLFPGTKENGLPATTGKIQLKMPGKECPAKTPNLLRLYRAYQKKYTTTTNEVHLWGRAASSFIKALFPNIKDENSGLCYASGTLSDCPSLVKVGRDSKGKRIAIEGENNYEVFLGYCSKKYGECGATEKIQELVRRSDQNYLYLAKNHPNSINGPLGYVVQRELPCYFWPGFVLLNCATPGGEIGPKK